VSSASASPLIARLAERTAAREREGVLRRLRTSDAAPPGRRRFEGRTLVDFGSNDYLGLASDPRVIEATREGARIWGVGAGAAHLLGGHTRVHEAAQEAIADWTGRESALLFGCGYLANLGIAQALVGTGDTLVEDKLNHASLIDAARISGARLLRYAHADCGAASRRLETLEGSALLCTDSVFSMDGDVADLPALARICEANAAALWVDDAHGIGVLGASGAGAAVAAGLGQAEVPVYMATLGKALGVSGACVAGERRLIEGLVQFARTFVYTTASPPALAHALIASIAIARSEGWRRQHLSALGTRLRAGLASLGYESRSATPIVPVVVGCAQRAIEISAALFERGFWVPAIRPPTVPDGTARLRVSLCAAHELSDVERLLDVLSEFADVKMPDATVY
jgi:8-amino-7-oxononanoate synthase